MKEHKVELLASPGLFRGLASQNMLFHECIGELVDNAVAATPDGERFEVNIILDKKNEEVVDVWITDNSSGMDLNNLKAALQPGESATKNNRLNEHGFGLKNALATLSGDEGSWEIWSKSKKDVIHHVKGPFDRHMNIIERKKFPQQSFFPRDISTVIKVAVKMSFIRTVQGRGQPTHDLAKLRPWLIEHLGVHYRGYLEPDKDTNEPSGKIFVAISKDKSLVKPIQVPMVSSKVERIEVELGGEPYTLEYIHGVLDVEKARNLKFYYRNNVATQGIDIRLGKRVIITRQLKTIWRLERDNHYNYFVGELKIPEMPRGILTTKNDKTDFNLTDPDWQTIFEKLGEFPPKKEGNKQSEKELKEKWKKMLQATTDDEVIQETSVWETSVKIDIYQRSGDDITIYEAKIGAGKPLDLYQMKMYWDGLVITGEKPVKAVLIVESASDNLKKMAVSMNEKLPKHGKHPYNFQIATHEEKGLVDSSAKKRKR